MSVTQTDEDKIDWSERFWNPMMQFKWNAEIRIEPANKEKGDMIGFRIFPDGTREPFLVE